MKIQIELNDYNATCLLAFLSAFLIEFQTDKKLSQVNKAYSELFDQVTANITQEQFERIKIEYDINVILGKEPEA